jgi:Protein of unknown function (DUF3300)
MVAIAPRFEGRGFSPIRGPDVLGPERQALVAFPSVLANMDKNPRWTSSLGDAYYNQEQGIRDAVQVLRRAAQKAGNLNSTPQQTVITEGSDIQIEPVSPEIVYVPAYDPWNVYGDPIVAWPGWYRYPGIWYEGPALFFGVGFSIGVFGHYGMGLAPLGFRLASSPRSFRPRAVLLTKPDVL